MTAPYAPRYPADTFGPTGGFVGSGKATSTTNCGQTATAPYVVTITAHQRAVVGELTKDGAENKVIGRRLGMSVETVRSHLSRAMAAAGAENRTHLVILLLRGDVKVRVGDGRQRDSQGSAS